MARLFLVRHGEAAAAYGEQDDPGLSFFGRGQAEAAAGALADVPVAAIWTSPLRRCRETAEPFAKASSLVPRVREEIAEVPTPPGVADRRVWLAVTFPWIRAAHVPSTRWSELGALAAWREAMIAAAKEAEGVTVAFTHFIAINALVSAALKRDETIVCRPAPGSITELAVEDGELRLVALGAQVGDPIVL